MTPAEERTFEVKAEKMLRGHRELPNGRNFLSFYMRYQNNDAYRRGFQLTPEEGTRARQWVDGYCPKCDKLKEWCECQKP